MKRCLPALIIAAAALGPFSNARATEYNGDEGGFHVFCDDTPCHGPISGAYNDGNFFVFVDYTIPTDGLSQQWNFWIRNGDPNALLELDEPNEIYTSLYYVTAEGGLEDTFGPRGAYSFEQIYDPTNQWLKILVSGPTAHIDCDDTSTSGYCGTYYAIWGNGTALGIKTDRHWTLHFSIGPDPFPIPELSTWVLLIMGMGAAGATIRVRRREMPRVRQDS
jgi:hypothetical protein